MSMFSRRTRGSLLSRRRVASNRSGRRLAAETLERRQLLAGDLGFASHQNAWIPLDVNDDLRITPLDALIVINELNRGGPRDLTLEERQSSQFLDVNGDGRLSAIDALLVINALDRGEAVGEVVEFRIDAVDDLGQSLLAPGSRELTIGVDQRFNIEFQYIDLRSPAFTREGMFTAYVDILTDMEGVIEPLLIEYQILGFDDNFGSATGGSFTLGLEGSSTTVDVPLSQFNNNPTATLRTAVESLGFPSGSVSVASMGGTAEHPFRFSVRFQGDEFFNVDIPNLTVDTGGVVAPDPVGAAVTEVPVRQPDGSFNNTLLREQLDLRSFALGGERFYRNGVTGTFAEGDFIDIGAFGGLDTVPQFAADNQLTVDMSQPIDAFRIPVRAVTPVEGMEVVIGYPSTSDVVLYGRDERVPESLVLIDLEDNPAIEGDDRFGMFILNAVEAIRTVDDTLTFDEGAPAQDRTINVLANDENFGAPPLTLQSVTQPASGTVTFQAGGNVTYTPQANFFGTDVFTYTARNGDGATATGTVTVTVNFVNVPPVAEDDGPFEVQQDQSRVFTEAELIANDHVGRPQEEDFQTLTIVSATATAQTQGTVTFNPGDRSVTFAPAAGFFGQTSFRYTVSDGIATDTATVFVNVLERINVPPVARDDEFVVDELSIDEFLDVLANDDAGEGDDDQTIEVHQITVQPTNGTATIAPDGIGILYTPNVDFIGADSLQYTIRDSAGGISQAATVTIDVVPAVRPRARDDRFVVPADSPAVALDVLANDLANPGNQVTLEAIGAVTQGQATLVRDDRGTPDDPTDDRILFTPEPGFFGTVVFTYTIGETDGEVTDVDAATGTVTVTVTPPVSTLEDTPVDIPVSDLVAPGSTVTAVSATSEKGGTVVLDGSVVRFTPAPNYNDAIDGPDSFTYTITHGSGATSTATAIVSITPVNDPPVLDLPTLTTTEDVTLTMPVSEFLADSLPGPPTATDELATQTLSIAVLESPSGVVGMTEHGGTITVSAGVLTYVPAPDFFGTDRFVVEVADDGDPVATTRGTVEIEVAFVNKPPVFGDPEIIAFKDATITFSQAQLLANSVPGPPNESFQQLSVVGAAAVGATQGTVTFNADGTVTYQPPADFTGTDTFQITIRDDDPDNPRQVTGLVTVSVQEFVPSTISGSVFFDFNQSKSKPFGNGVQDPNEPGLQGVPIRLVSSAQDNVTGQAIQRTHLTDIGGDFRFTNVPPGTYIVSFTVPQSVIDGPDFAGTLGDADTVENQFTIVIPEPGGLEASGYNFTVRGLNNSAGELLDILAYTYMRNNPDAPTGEMGLHGARALLDADGSMVWFRPGSGWEGIRFGEIVLNQDQRSARVTVLTAEGDLMTKVISNDQFRMVTDAHGNTAIEIFGSFASLQFTAAGTGSAIDGEFLRYREAIDQILAQNDSLF